MSLTRDQQHVAATIYGLALNAGLSPARARELVAAAYAESSLNPRATNKSSGAAGLFQLLSSGYRTKAQSLGGLYDPVANTQAILPSYVSYWKSHPNAQPGEAGRDVELSGEGAGFYSDPLSLLGSLGGATVPPAPQSSPLRANGVSPPVVPTPLSRAALAQVNAGFRAHGPVSPLGLPEFTQPVFPQQEMLPTAPASQKGKVGRPAKGKLIGTPYSGTHTLGNWESDNAIDVALPVGTPIRAPFDGVIGSQFGSLGKSGRFAGLRLHIAGAEDEWYGAHLSRFAPGIHPGLKVHAGQIIGYSGSANGVAHLHQALKHGNPLGLFR